ncbi:symporter small accessory protein [Bacteroides sp.]
MFGINDPLVVLPYVLMIVCVLFSAWFGIKYWNKDDEKDKTR